MHITQRTMMSWFLVFMSLVGCAADTGSKEPNTPQSGDGDAGTKDDTGPNLPQFTLEEDPCASMLIPGAVDHACIHALRGPYSTVKASGTFDTDVNISERHTFFTIELSETEGGYHGYLRFRHEQPVAFPNYPQPYFMLGTGNENLQLFVLDSAQNPSTARYADRVSPRNPQCGLRYAFVYPLATALTHTFYLYSPTRSEVTLVAEHLFDYVDAQWVQECADE